MHYARLVPFLLFNAFYIICLIVGRDDESPFPSKATLARSATRRPTKKVPPISSSDKYSREDDVDSAYAASMESTLEAESHLEVCIVKDTSKGNSSF